MAMKNRSVILLLQILIFTLMGVLAKANEMPVEVSPYYKEWKWMQSTCQNCAIRFSTDREELRNPKVEDFLYAIERQKQNLLEIYKSDPQEYNLLALMAVGIIGRESEFFNSPRYAVKEAVPWAVSVIKAVQVYLSPENDRVTPSSRGPTQIKVIPKLIAQHYGITPSDLKKPRAAAVATMGFLIEALQELKTRARNNNWDFVTKATYADYLPYIYFGSIGQLKNRTATPDRNLYIQSMRKYMAWVKIYEFKN